MSSVLFNVNVIEFQSKENISDKICSAPRLSLNSLSQEMLDIFNNNYPASALISKPFTDMEDTNITHLDSLNLNISFDISEELNMTISMFGEDKRQLSEPTYSIVMFFYCLVVFTAGEIDPKVNC